MMYMLACQSASCQSQCKLHVLTLKFDVSISNINKSRERSTILLCNFLMFLKSLVFTAPQSDPVHLLGVTKYTKTRIWDHEQCL